MQLRIQIVNDPEKFQYMSDPEIIPRIRERLTFMHGENLRVIDILYDYTKNLVTVYVEEVG